MLKIMPLPEEEKIAIAQAVLEVLFQHQLSNREALRFLKA